VVDIGKVIVGFCLLHVEIRQDEAVFRSDRAGELSLVPLLVDAVAERKICENRRYLSRGLGLASSAEEPKPIFEDASAEGGLVHLVGDVIAFGGGGIDSHRVPTRIRERVSERSAEIVPA